MTAPDTSPRTTVRFPHRSRRGVLVGLTWPQLTVAAIGLAFLLATVLALGVAAALQMAPLWGVFGAVVGVRHRGRALAEWAPIAGRYALRRMRGQLVWLTRPTSRPKRAGLLHLPGTAASLRVTSSPDGRLSAVHDPHRGTLTAVLRVSSRAYVLLDAGVQNSNVQGWGRLLASLARSGHIARIQVLERTVPDSGDALHRYWNDHGRSDAPMADVYADLLAAAGPAAAPHETYVAVALDLVAARRLVNQAGGGLTGAFAVLSQLLSSLNESARHAGLTSIALLGPTEIAAVVRTAYDPAAKPTLDQWSRTEHPRAAPDAAGPVIVVEQPDRIRTDSAAHAVYWVENWPRTETYAGFLHQMMFTSGVRRTLSLTYAPKPLDAALRDVRRRKAGVMADASERARRGQVENEADAVEYADIRERERQLIAGHADVGLVGLVSVSADSDDELNAACAQIETAAVGSLVDLRRLTWQQAEAYARAALPLALP